MWPSLLSHLLDAVRQNVVGYSGKSIQTWNKVPYAQLQSYYCSQLTGVPPRAWWLLEISATTSTGAYKWSLRWKAWFEEVWLRVPDALPHLSGISRTDYQCRRVKQLWRIDANSRHIRCLSEHAWTFLLPSLWQKAVLPLLERRSRWQRVRVEERRLCGRAVRVTCGLKQMETVSSLSYCRRKDSWLQPYDLPLPVV